MKNDSIFAPWESFGCQISSYHHLDPLPPDIATVSVGGNENMGQMISQAKHNKKWEVDMVFDQVSKVEFSEMDGPVVLMICFRISAVVSFWPQNMLVFIGEAKGGLSNFPPKKIDRLKQH